MWKLSLPTKVKIFLWRVCTDTLPTRVKLHTHGVSLEVSCGVCHGPSEDMNHIFLSCPVAIQSWALSHLSTKVHLDKARQVTIWLPTLRHQLPRKDVELVAVTLWNLWNNHNGVTFAGPYHDPLSLVSLSMNFLHQYRETISKPVHGSITFLHCQCILPRWN